MQNVLTAHEHLEFYKKLYLTRQLVTRPLRSTIRGEFSWAHFEIFSMKFSSFAHADLEHFDSATSVVDISDTLNSRAKGRPV